MNVLLDLVGSLPALCRNLLQIGLGLALQSTLLLGLGLLAGQRLRGRGPALPAFIYRATLVSLVLSALLAMPIGGRLSPHWVVTLPSFEEGGSSALLPVNGAGWRSPATGRPRPWLTGEPDRTATAGMSGSGRDGTVPPGPDARQGAPFALSPDRASSLSHAPPPLPRTTWMGWLYVAMVGLWAAGALLLLVRLGRCHRSIGRLRTASAPANEEAMETLRQLCQTRASASPRRRVRLPVLRVSSDIRSPVLTGLRRSVILLPSSYDRLFEPAALRAVLAHELGHFARRDCAWLLFAQLTGAVAWVQPLIWVLARRLEESSEELCDEEVLIRDAEPHLYARCLVDLAEHLLPRRVDRSAGAAMATCRTTIERRVRNILSQPRRAPKSLTSRLRAAVVVGALGAGAAGLLLVTITATPPEGSPVRAADATSRSGKRGRAVLEVVRELQKPVSYTETKIALGDLVQKVAADTGAPLDASPEVADEPVVVVVKEMPARALLERLARLLDYQWMRRQSRQGWQYQIYQDVASRQREVALRQSALAGMEARFQEELKQTVRMAALPLEKIRQIRYAGEQRTKERKSLLPEQQRAMMLSEPVSRALGQLAGRLTPAHWAVLRRGAPLIFATEPAAGELPLPEEVTRLCRQARPEMSDGMSYSDPEIAEGQRQFHQGEANEWAAAAGFRVVFQLKWRSFPGSLSLEAKAQPARRFTLPRFDPTQPHLITDYGSFYFSGGGGTGLDVSVNAVDMELTGFEDTARRDPSIVTDPIFGARKYFQPDRKRRPNHLGVRPDVNLGLFRDQMPDLARTYGVQFIGDAYRITGRCGAARPSQPAPLYVMLDHQACSNDRWERDGDVALVRSRTWFFDRQYEIPLRIVRRWKQISDQYGLLSMDEWVQSARELTDRQLEHIFHVTYEADLAPDFAPGRPGGEEAAGPTLRLYGSLTPAQQRALWQGRPIAVAAMTPPQQRLFEAAVRATTRDWMQPFDPSLIAGGRLALHHEEAMRTWRPWGTNGRHAATEPLPSDGAAAPTSDRTPPAKRVTTKDGVTRYAMSTVTLQLFFGPLWPAGTRIYVRWPS